MITHLSPAAFGEDGLWGGGERYPLELAKAMADIVPTRLVTFGPRRKTLAEGRLKVEILPTRGHWRGGALNPLAPELLPILLRSELVHAHQLESVNSNLAIVLSRLTRNKVVCTDHGGMSRNFSRILRLESSLDHFLPVSSFSASFYPELAAKATVIYGGVDTNRYKPSNLQRERKIVFVGRLLPHKGLDVLLEALPQDLRLEIYGRSYDAEYRTYLSRMAANKPVAFFEAASDATVIRALQTARALVLPSVTRTHTGAPAPRSELLGLVLLEGMACGLPVVATRTGGLAEIVVDGQTGLLVPQCDPAALTVALSRLVSGGPLWEEMSRRALETVRSQFTWDEVARRCLKIYKQL